MGKIAKIRRNKNTVIINHKEPVPNLEGLRNVDINSLINGQVLQWNGSSWVNVDSDVVGGGEFSNFLLMGA